MFREDEITYSTNEAGHKTATINVDSSNLPYVTVDTYSTFTGEGWWESTVDHLVETHGRDMPEVDYEVDHRKLLELLAENARDSLEACLPGVDPVVTLGEVTGVFSPRAYNFSTDSYNAHYTIDLELMEEWITEHEWDHEAYGLEHFSSYDGFHSYVPRWLNDEDYAVGVRLWLFLHAYIAEEVDRDEMFYALFEEDWSIFDQACTVTVDRHALQDRIAAKLEALVEDVDESEAESMAMDVDHQEVTETMLYDPEEYRAWIDQQLTEIVDRYGLTRKEEELTSPHLAEHRRSIAAVTA